MKGEEYEIEWRAKTRASIVDKRVVNRIDVVRGEDALEALVLLGPFYDKCWTE